MRESSLPVLPPGLGARAQAEAEILANGAGGVRAVVIATADGFDVASAVRGEVDPARVAALASSIAAIGEVVSREVGLGRAQAVTVGTDDGFAVIRSTRYGSVELVINVVATRDALLGEVNYRSAEAARSLAAG